ncbi:MAG: hypothetical protein ACHQFX_21550 [Chitinophagales bacterium]
MKRLALIFIPALAFFNANAQSEMIRNVFRRLPAYAVYDLTIATRDSMLQGKTYYPADNDSADILAYNYGTSDDVKDYLYVSMSFESGQRGSGMIEIRSFKMMSGVKLIMLSKTGGVWNVIYEQHDVSAFVYSKGKKLIPYEKKFLPATDESIFMKQGIPDSVKKAILNNSNMTFDLSSEKLMLSLNTDYISRTEILRKWLKGDRVYFDWIRDHFVISKMEFQDGN